MQTERMSRDYVLTRLELIAPLNVIDAQLPESLVSRPGGLIHAADECGTIAPFGLARHTVGDTFRARGAAMQQTELVRLHAGDDRFFGTLLSSVEAMLRRQIRRYVGVDRDAEDDLFQDVAIKIFERRQGYRGEGPFGAWCYRLCGRVCADHVRRAARAQRRMPLVDGPYDAAADSRSEHDRTRTAEAFQTRLDAVTDAVVALAPRRRLIAISHWYLGWTAAHIARELHLTAPTVWTTLSQIRATLRQELTPRGRTLFARRPKPTRGHRIRRRSVTAATRPDI